MVDFKQKEKYDINDLLEIMRLLRAPGGCPWDAQQTHMSIRKNLIEETYEVIEAIDKDDKELMTPPACFRRGRGLRCRRCAQ